MKWGPTSANLCPARIVFVRTSEGKQRLLPCVSPGNLEKTRKAPVTAIVGFDLEYYKQAHKLFPSRPEMRENVSKLPSEVLRDHAFRNGTLQGAYFMLAARSLGLDCGPMSGFDNAKLDAAFFAGTTTKSNFLCNLGYGDPSKLHPRSPRLSFAEACRIE